MSNNTTPEELWCVHILGPDDLYAAPSKAEAERAVAHMKQYWEKRHPEDAALNMVRFEVEPWPYSPASHANGVATFYNEIGISTP